ncbi:hypothetical protein sos41_00450 [Alphaproteobacteria bacterium SO-S41]|nr:hypothetical protein sos41_00450 [Alphaproteobacteria bacterium SO-S41]
MSGDPRAVLDEAGKAGTGDIDIAAAALALSAIARPGLDTAPLAAHVAGLGPAAQGALEQIDNHREVAAVLAATLHGVFGYTGDRKTYDDLGNADLATVIERRRGLPVALGILYIHTARALGASAHGINFPGHFLVGLATKSGAILTDPFNGGRTVDGDDLEAMLPRGTPLDQGHIAALSDRGTLIRLQNNIVTRAREADDWARVAVTLETLMRIAPDAVNYRYEWGAALARIEQPIAARTALGEALLREPQAPWANDARALLGRLNRSLN